MPILYEPYAYTNFPTSTSSVFPKFGVCGWRLIPAVFPPLVSTELFTHMLCTLIYTRQEALPMGVALKHAGST